MNFLKNNFVHKLCELFELNTRLANNLCVLSENNSVFSEVTECESNVNLDLNFGLKIFALNVEKIWHSSGESVANNDKHFKCFWPKCRFSTKYRGDLNKHKISHSNARQYKCLYNNCNKEFIYKRYLNLHKL